MNYLWQITTNTDWQMALFKVHWQMWDMRIEKKNVIQRGKLSKLFPSVFFRCKLRLDNSHCLIETQKVHTVMKHIAMETQRAGSSREASERRWLFSRVVNRLLKRPIQCLPTAAHTLYDLLPGCFWDHGCFWSIEWQSLWEVMMLWFHN